MATNEELKTLLVIGNGFDLAHGLKTRYTDFLDCVKELQNSLNERQEKSVERLAENHIRPMKKDLPPVHYLNPDKYKKIETEKNRFKETYKQKLKQLHENENYLKKCREKIQSSLKSGKFLKPRLIRYTHFFGNIWLSYFNKIQNEKLRLIGENWVDFENEMTSIIQKFEKYILNLENMNDEERKKIDRDMSHFVSSRIDYNPKILFQKDIPRMDWDLKILTLLLEQYLIEEEKNLKADTKEFFKTLNPEAVISYNYSHSFQKLYTDKKIYVHFIHGELGKHNLVLGIGETLSDDKKDVLTVCASFKKFFQIIKYKLGNQYKKITQSDNQNIVWQVIIYGHSLDSTDKDSLKWLMQKWTGKKNVKSCSE